VSPVYNEGQNAVTLVDRLEEVFRPLPYQLSIVLVDDGSGAETVAILDKLAAERAAVAVIHLSRNFGHQAALTAGIDHADGDAVIVMDSDLQHPPELLPEMLVRWEAGRDVVYAVRSADPSSGFVKRLTSQGFYRVLSALSDHPIPAGAADFRLMDRRALGALRGLRERTRFLRGLSAWVGFSQEGLPYVPAPRKAGEPKFTTAKMLRLAFHGLISMSTLPLRLSLFIGFALAAVSGAYMVYVVLAFFFANRPIVWGWPSLIIAVIFLGGLQINMIGVVGLYIARIYEEVKGRPIYVVARLGGFLTGREVLDSRGPEERRDAGPLAG
jgi:dolichol-phosphate mannosyltransferase